MTDSAVDTAVDTSLRVLQEMRLPAQEGLDVTAASGINMKQYEEQLNGLKKENFHLKLRIYFLEEKLESGSPPAVQGLLEHNVRLQVEVEELRRQLTDKQELLEDAIKAIDVLEHQIEKYDEILRCKDEHIKDLENKLRELQNTVDNVQNDDEAGNLQQLLTRRLQGLAYFLDKLLSHKCVLSEEKKRLAESILEQSLALPVGLQLDESISAEGFAFDDSNMDISQNLRIEDLTVMFGHHGLCSDDNKHVNRKAMRHLLQNECPSESEYWSEPDKNVSHARIGLDDTALGARESTADNNRHRSRRSKVSCGSRSEDKTTNEAALIDEIHLLTKQRDELEHEKRDLISQLDFAKTQTDDLISEKDEMKDALNIERSKLEVISKDSEDMKSTISALQLRIKDTEQRLADAIQVREKLRSERQELESSFMETERALRRAADDATVQASQAALDRARTQHEKMRLEKDLKDARENLATSSEIIANLEMEVARKVAVEACDRVQEVHAAREEDDRPTSPDQGIDSDRLSSLEHNDSVILSPRSLYEENVSLKQKLERTKTTLADTLSQLNAATIIKKGSVPRAICREIHKTQGVLRKARDHLESKN